MLFSAWFQVTSELNLSETARNGISIRPFSIIPLSILFDKLLAKLIAGLPISKVHTKESVSASIVFFIDDSSHGSIISLILTQSLFSKNKTLQQIMPEGSGSP
jgi:hypothetical protein